MNSLNALLAQSPVSFLWPQLLWLLLILPLLVLLYWWLLRRRRQTALRFASLAIVREAMGKGPGWRRHVPPVLLLFALGERFAIAQTAGADGTPNHYALYDLGQSVAHFSVQAQTDGLYVHQVAGTDVNALKEAFNLPAGFEAFVAIAVGKLAPADELPEPLAEREKAPRVRHELAEIVRYDAFED